MPAAPPLQCKGGREIVDNLSTPINRAVAYAWSATAAERLIFSGKHEPIGAPPNAYDRSEICRAGAANVAACLGKRKPDRTRSVARSGRFHAATD